MSIELRHLRCFIAVADAGQISAAAQGMHLAQPALSQTIRQLERELDVALFERHPRGVRLTPAAEDLLPHARAAIRSSEDVIAAGRAHAREQNRRIMVGFLPPLTYLAADLLRAYEHAHPRIKIDARQLDFADHVEAVERRQVDVALVWAWGEPESVVFEALLEEPRAVCLASSHPLASQPYLRFEQVEDEPLPGLPPDFPQAVDDFLHLADRRRRPARHAEFVPGSMDEGIWQIASGRAICVGPLSLARALTRPGLVTIPLADVDPVTIAIARRADDSRAAVRAFSHAAREHLRQVDEAPQYIERTG